MYPLNMKLKEGIGFAVANDEEEHASLEAAGYGPGRSTGGVLTGSTAPVPATQADLATAVRAQLDAAGISYPDGLGLAKLVALLPKE